MARCLNIPAKIPHLVWLRCRVVNWPARVSCVHVWGEWEGGSGGLVTVSTWSSGPCILNPRLPPSMFMNIFQTFYLGRLFCMMLHHIILQYYIAPHPPFKDHWVDMWQTVPIIEWFSIQTFQRWRKWHEWCMQRSYSLICFRHGNSWINQR